MLIARLAEADTPYRAWAAVALLTAASARYRTEGRRLAIDLADWMPPAEDLQHADFAAYTLLEGAGHLSAEQRDRLRATLPFPHRERERRARLYSSSPYLYMVARGVGSSLACVGDLARVVEEELESVTERVSPDLVDLSLLLAARLELAGVAPVADEELRRASGRIAGAEDSREGAVALHWLLEIYGSRWPAGQAAEGLRETATAYVGRSAVPDPPPAEDRPVALVMQLETATRRSPELRLVSRAGEEAALAERLGRRRWTEAAAYLFVITVLAGGTMYAAASAGWFGPLVAWAGALGWGVPAATYALLVVSGRPRDVVVLGVGVSLGLLYWSAALYAGYTNSVDWLRLLGDEGALLELLVATFTSFWAGVNALRNR